MTAVFYLVLMLPAIWLWDRLDALKHRNIEEPTGSFPISKEDS